MTWIYNFDGDLKIKRRFPVKEFLAPIRHKACRKTKKSVTDHSVGDWFSGAVVDLHSELDFVFNSDNTFKCHDAFVIVVT